MNTVILVLKIILWLYLLIGLIKPSYVLRVREPNRWKVAGVWLVALFFVYLVDESYRSKIELGDIEDTDLKTYVTRDFDILLPANLKERRDTVFMTTGEIRFIILGVSG